MAKKKSIKKETRGRKLIVSTPEKLQSLIDDYFQLNAEKKTISGLAYHLGFESRQSFYDYEKNKIFSYTIKRARLRMESIYEANLQSNNATGSIFALKNLGWHDKTELTGADGKDLIPSITIELIDSSDKIEHEEENPGSK
jgi:hypothetical protein